jgi:hypothetical protein
MRIVRQEIAFCRAAWLVHGGRTDGTDVLRHTSVTAMAATELHRRQSRKARTHRFPLPTRDGSECSQICAPDALIVVVDSVVYSVDAVGPSTWPWCVTHAWAAKVPGVSVLTPMLKVAA